jgi:hypothetical protein
LQDHARAIIPLVFVFTGEFYLNMVTETATLMQDFYKLNGKPVYVLVESREYEK